MIKRETTELGTETRPGKGVIIEEVSKHQDSLSLAGLGEVFESQWATYLGGKINKTHRVHT